MPEKKSVLPARFWIDAAMLCIGIVLMLTTAMLMQPRFSNVTLQRADTGEETIESMPVVFMSGDTTAVVEYSMHTPALHPRLYQFIPDDCVRAMQINGQEVTEIEEPMCDYVNGFILNIGKYLNPGINKFTVSMHNAGGPAALNMRIATEDTVFLYTFIILALALSWLLYTVVRSLPGNNGTRMCAFIICTALAIRILYLFGTTYEVRAHDVGGHIEYLQFLLEHWSLPTEGSGWQWYQPPLYYLTLAPMMAMMQALHFSETIIFQTLQYPSFFSGLIIIALSMWVASVLFPKKSQRVSSYLFIGLIASFPSLIYTSARINNDVFVTIFGFAALSFLIAWWRGKSLRHWYISIFLCGLALLSKSNALLLLPIVFGCMLFAKSITRRDKGLHISLGLLLMGTLTSWLFAMRFFAHLQPSIVGNIGSLNSGLRLHNTFAHLTRFDISSIVGHIYNNAWDDAAGRQYFWEYLYRSSFFGEFSFPDSVSLLAMGMVLFGFVVLATLLYGAAYSWIFRPYKDLPMLLTLIVLMLGHLVFRMNFPYSSSQDMRYSVLVILPMAYFVCIAIEHVPRRIATLLTAITIVFVLLCTLFLASISIL